MPDLAVLKAILAGIVGLALIGGVFWLTFRNPPARRSDGGLTQHDASKLGSGDGGGPSL